jgi:glycyl-tRNA synthetase beta chain
VSELLLELLSEEIPARMQSRAIEGLTSLLRDKLAAAQIPAESISGYVTPRRLTVVAEGIVAAQPDRTEERRGPRVGAPQPAIAGFLRSAGIALVTECEIRDTDRGKFYFAVVNRPGRPAGEVLPELILGAMAELPWPKSMRYPASDLRWIRPLNSVLCLFDGQVLPLPLGRVPVGRTTRGHRFLAPDEICVTSAADYVERLCEAHVVLDRDRRMEAIRQGLEEATAAEELSLKPDVALLDEVAGLVEFPVVLTGAIDADFMALPPEVLATAMRAHQKYFSCLRPDGTPAPRFLFVANNVTTDGGKTIIAGNERVLRARLADARFFWDQDRRVPLESRVGALADRVFHAKLGSLRDKIARMEALADFLARHIPGADVARSRRAVRLAKADLSTGMVAEFPELQGVMGRYYALHDGEDPAIAQAIADHYRPLGPNDPCPTAPESVVVALADKLDSLVAFFAIGEKPTGSRDPFALRRAALGTIRLVLENKLRVPLFDCFVRAADHFKEVRDPKNTAAELLGFFAERLEIHLRERGIRRDVVRATFVHGGLRSPNPHTFGNIQRLASEFGGEIDSPEQDLVRLIARAEALQRFLASEDGANLLVAYRRASNIVAIEERRDGRSYDDPLDPSVRQQPEEVALYQRLNGLSETLETFLINEHFDRAMARLATLRPPVDEFFDKVTVNTEDRRLRENRLRLLSRIRATMNQVADFSQIEG